MGWEPSTHTRVSQEPGHWTVLEILLPGSSEPSADQLPTAGRPGVTSLATHLLLLDSRHLLCVLVSFSI